MYCKSTMPKVIPTRAGHLCSLFVSDSFAIRHLCTLICQNSLSMCVAYTVMLFLVYYRATLSIIRAASCGYINFPLCQPFVLHQFDDCFQTQLIISVALFYPSISCCTDAASQDSVCGAAGFVSVVLGNVASSPRF